MRKIIKIKCECDGSFTKVYHLKVKDILEAILSNGVDNNMIGGSYIDECIWEAIGFTGIIEEYNMYLKKFKKDIEEDGFDLTVMTPEEELSEVFKEINNQIPDQYKPFNVRRKLNKGD